MGTINWCRPFGNRPSDIQVTLLDKVLTISTSQTDHYAGMYDDGAGNLTATATPYQYARTVRSNRSTARYRTYSYGGGRNAGEEASPPRRPIYYRRSAGNRMEYSRAWDGCLKPVREPAECGDKYGHGWLAVGFTPITSGPHAEDDR